MAKIRATHRLLRPHEVFYDPKVHLKLDNPPEPGSRIRLPAGTHLIPTAVQLAALPTRFESLAPPEPPAEVEVEDDEDNEPEDEDPDGSKDEPEDEGSEDGASTDGTETPSEEDETESENTPAHEAVDEALAAVNGAWEAMLSDQLEDLAAGYDIGEDDIEGMGSGGNVLKADWISTVQRAREEGA